MRFSLVTLAITMIFGILLTSQFGILTAGVISLTAMVGFLIWSFYKKTLDVGLLIIIIAFAVSSFSDSFSVSSTVHKSLNYINRYVTLNGVIISTAKSAFRMKPYSSQEVQLIIFATSFSRNSYRFISKIDFPVFF